jgi:hypothetical protein
MYSQGLIGADSATQETQEFLDRFQTRIDAEEKIEPNDPMPEGFRRTLIRRSASTRTRKSSACCRKATGSPARRR